MSTSLFPISPADAYGTLQVVAPEFKGHAAQVHVLQGHAAPDSTLAGESVAVRRLRSQVQRIAPHFRIALLRGEAGTGKQHVARAIHALSSGADGPFVVAKAATLAEAVADRRIVNGVDAAAGLVESAHSGLLYLEGVGEVPMRYQKALSQFLRSCEDRRSHVTPGRRLDVRFLAETHRDLRTLMATGGFRQDLYGQLSVVEMNVPTLRQRLDDLQPIAAHMLRRIAHKAGMAPQALAKDALERLKEYSWPGNLTELERCLRQAVSLADGGEIEPRHLLAVAETKAVAAESSVKVERLHDVMQAHVAMVLTRCGGNKLRAAEMLGISRSTLYRMLDAAPATVAATG